MTYSFVTPAVWLCALTSLSCATESSDQAASNTCCSLPSIENGFSVVRDERQLNTANSLSTGSLVPVHRFLSLSPVSSQTVLYSSRSSFCCSAVPAAVVVDVTSSVVSVNLLLLSGSCRRRSRRRRSILHPTHKSPSAVVPFGVPSQRFVQPSRSTTLRAQRRLADVPVIRTASRRCSLVTLCKTTIPFPVLSLPFMLFV